MNLLCISLLAKLAFFSDMNCTLNRINSQETKKEPPLGDSYYVFNNINNKSTPTVTDKAQT